MSWDWTDAHGPARLRSELDERGFSLLRSRALALDLGPDGLYERLLREVPLRLSVHEIRHREGARQWVASRDHVPLHTDARGFGLPPQVLVMACRGAAAAGGECTLLDTWSLLARIEGEQPDLFQALFERVRVIPFGVTRWIGATFSSRYGNLVCTHSPALAPDDAVGRRFLDAVNASEPLVLDLAPGDVLVVNNHRMLHGRRAFAGAARCFLRLLAWTPWAFEAPAPLRALAGAARERIAAGARAADWYTRERLCGAGETQLGYARLAAVQRALRAGDDQLGEIAREAGVTIREMLRWCDVAFAASAASLSETLPPEASGERTPPG